MDLLKEDGGVVATNTFNPLAPGHSTAVAAVSNAGPGNGNFFWCRFTVVDNSRTAIRASIDFNHQYALPAE